MKWYRFEREEVVRKCETRFEGLTASEAKERLKEYGPNRLPEEESISKLKILLHQFTSPLIYILFVAAIVTAILNEYIE